MRMESEGAKLMFHYSLFLRGRCLQVGATLYMMKCEAIFPHLKEIWPKCILRCRTREHGRWNTPGGTKQWWSVLGSECELCGGGDLGHGQFIWNHPLDRNSAWSTGNHGWTRAGNIIPTMLLWRWKSNWNMYNYKNSVSLSVTGHCFIEVLNHCKLLLFMLFLFM